VYAVYVLKILILSFFKYSQTEKDVLDVGCNVGHFTLLIARDFSPRKIVGIDIDGSLIECARKNVRHYATAQTRYGSA